MSESRLPMSESRPEVIEVTAVPLERPRPRRPEKRSMNLFGIVVLAIVLFMVFKFLIIAAILLMLVFALPRAVPGGLGRLLQRDFRDAGRRRELHR